MLPNADILRIDRATGVNAAGETVFGTGPDIIAGALRGRIGNIASKQKFTLGALIEDCTLLLSVRKADLAAAGEDPPVNGIQVVFAIDGEDAQTGEVGFVQDYVLNGQDGPLTRWQLFLRKV